MPISKNQQKSLTEVRLLEAAVLLFSNRGFNGTGTREIAKLAGVNEATLFRHYSNKKELFWAALEARLTRLKFGRELQSALGADAPPRVALPLILDFLVRTVSEQPELIRLLYVSALELEGGQDLYRKHLGAIFDCINTYLLNCAKRQVICKVDAPMTTFAFAGTVIAQLSAYHVFVDRALPFANLQEATAAFSEFWLRILEEDISSSDTESLEDVITADSSCIPSV